MFELFDPGADVQIHYGDLPHWYQPGVTYFITFRTDDSVPASLAERWYRDRNEWLHRHGINVAHSGWQRLLQELSHQQQAEYHQTFTREFQDYLDRGYGDCVLKRPQLAAIVGQSLRHFDGQRYHLGDFVVMPNHAHLLVCLLGDTDLEAQCYSWKKYTATCINKQLGKSGRFWQEESFDHLVRSPEQFEYLRRYIAENPKKAHLRDGEYLYYRRP